MQQQINMTFDEIKQIPDLQIEVTPAIEDAFYFLRSLETEMPDITDEESPEDYEARLSALYDPANNAGNRLADLPEDEKWQAIRAAYQMIDNIRKYGIPCAAWT